jgi:signal transduction histidine kinase
VLLVASLATTLLALANVAFMAQLMFISTHDLTLLGLLLGFSMGIAALLATELSVPLSADLRQIVQAVRRLGSGDLATRVHLSRRDELAQLAEVLNGMAEQLETGFVRERELEQARRELIAAISHDLRTPLASIRVMVEGMVDGVVDDEATVQRYLQTIHSEVDKLTQLINDLFELSQIDAGALELHLELVPVEELIADTVSSMAPQSEQKGLKLSSEAEKPLPAVMVDPLRIQRVLANLVQNALRHTPADGTIFIRARDVGSAVQVDVCDSGEGLPEGELGRVFERFYRADRSRSRGSGGAGLGLSIAKGIVEAHGGRIWAHNNDGQGATFSFTLPRDSAGAH